MRGLRFALYVLRNPVRTGEAVAFWHAAEISALIHLVMHDANPTAYKAWLQKWEEVADQ